MATNKDLENAKAVVEAEPSAEAAAGLTELVYIIDRSGSMGGLESDTIGGFNASIEKHRELPGKANVSVVLFDHEIDVVADRVDLEAIKPLDHESYYVRGCTALLDAVGGAVKHISRVQGYMPEGHKADHVIFTIITDGLENASKKYSYNQVKEMIQGAEARGWEFLFLGANIDAAAEAARLGIAEDRAVNYVPDSVGTAVAYEALAGAACEMRSCSAGKRIGRKWAKAVEADYAARG